MTRLSSPAHLRQVRTGNMHAVLVAMLDGPASRAELAQRTGLTKATVASLVEPLLGQRILAEGAVVNAGRGRPSRPLRFAATGPVAIGAEINVRHLGVTVQRLDASTEFERRIEVDNCRATAADIVTRLADLIRTAIAACGRDPLGIGLAVPGIVQDGAVVHTPNVPSLNGIHLGDQLAAELGRPGTTVAVDNEANLAALAHVWPHRLAGDDFVYVSGDVGIGAGIVIGGAMFRGRSGFAGELGHVIIERTGHPCPCGSRGCVEQYAGLDAIFQAAGKRDLAALLLALDHGDPRALAAVETASAALGAALAALINICDIETVVLGGSYAALFDHIAPGVHTELDTGVLAATRRPIHLTTSAFGRAAVTRGAAALITRRHCLEPNLLLPPGRRQ
ncbi:ROK family protein [Nocardia sp. NPDC052316]|uniref:ROK family protein n=1 Tax=Nocardia sp. NPDC052316 TaxID=3364329 RepID=UPI0037C533C2